MKHMASIPRTSNAVMMLGVCATCSGWSRRSATGTTLLEMACSENCCRSLGWTWTSGRRTDMLGMGSWKIDVPQPFPRSLFHEAVFPIPSRSHFPLPSHFVPQPFFHFLFCSPCPAEKFAAAFSAAFLFSAAPFLWSHFPVDILPKLVLRNFSIRSCLLSTLFVQHFSTFSSAALFLQNLPQFFLQHSCSAAPFFVKPFSCRYFAQTCLKELLHPQLFA